ncbi:MAG: anhydro-N-acetylmuramic acid kinase [Beijerinckiaceae bacterium]
MSKPRFYIGMMSGTSTDGVDAVLAHFDTGQPVQVAMASRGYDDALRAEIIALNSVSANEMHRAAVAANAIADLYAGVVADVLKTAAVQAKDVVAIGAHGQTIRHRPEHGYTTQIINSARLVEKTGIAVISDFRSRDMAAGGQGAPLVPAFHTDVFGDRIRHRAILNIGGISNVTLLAPGANAAGGFDCGPGNILLDYWCEKHSGARYDDDGQWARRGHVIAPLLEAMLAEPYFAAAPPKSTGRDLFSPAWLEPFDLQQFKPEDVQATLLALTAQTIAHDLRLHGRGVQDMFVCGGGALNGALMDALRTQLPALTIASTDALGIDPMAVEALAFAWLAMRFMARQPGNLPTVTGAQGLRVLGAYYPR